MHLTLAGVIGVLGRPLLFLLYFVSGFIPRRPGRWVFGSWSGWRFADNSGALFEYINQVNPPNLEVIWISRDATIVDTLCARGYRAYLPWSPAGLHSCLTASVYIYDGLTRDINHWTSRGARRVLLHHGSGIKKVERAIQHPQHRLYQLFHGNVFQRVFWTLLIPWHHVRADFGIATSPDQVKTSEENYGLRPGSQAITGLPRNDCLFLEPPADPTDEDIVWLLAQKQAQRPVFFYLPTFRDDPTHYSIPWLDLNNMCERLGITILIKPHFVDAQRHHEKGAAGCSRIQLATGDSNLNRLFHFVDGLVSDYSSSTFDFMLTGKPVIFFVPDLDQYLHYSRSLHYDYDEVTAGPKAKTLPELESAIRAALSTGVGEWAAQYETVLKRFHTYRDAHSCERSYQKIRLGVEPP